MYDLPVHGPTANMEAPETAAEVAQSADVNGAAWGMAARYRQLLQQQQQQRQPHADDEGTSSEPGSAGSRGPSPHVRTDTEAIEARDDSSDQDVLEKLKQQVANVAQDHAKDTNDNEAGDFRGTESLHSRDRSAEAFHRHPLSPQSLLAASMANNPPSLVPLPGLGLAGYGAAGGRASASPPVRENASPPVSSAGHSPRQAGAGQAPWNYEEQFKQLYEIDDNPKRKEFLDDLFRFMHNRGTPINRLPIMAKQVLDMFELYNLVVARGGLVEVINKKLWQEIIKGLKLPSSITSAAFTLRTQYMKYLYPQECQKENLSSPADLQAAIDGNRREGRRGGYSNTSYADFVQRSPLMASSMAQSFGLPNGMPTTLHQSGLSPLSLVTSRPGTNAAGGHPMPPSSPFLPGMGGPVLPSANDTLMTLWNLYNRQSAPSPPLRKPDVVGLAPQSEALNLGVHREMARQEREREHERERELAQEREREMERERHLSIKRERPDEIPPVQTANKKSRSADKERKPDAFPHTKMSISTKGDSSIVVSMELNGVGYQGVLFAQPRSARV